MHRTVHHGWSMDGFQLDYIGPQELEKQAKAIAGQELEISCTRSGDHDQRGGRTRVTTLSWQIYIHQLFSSMISTVQQLEKWMHTWHIGCICIMMTWSPGLRGRLGWVTRVRLCMDQGALSICCICMQNLARCIPYIQKAIIYLIFYIFFFKLDEHIYSLYVLN